MANDNNNQERLGDPMSGMPKPVAPKEKQQEKQAEPFQARKGDHGLGVPEFEPENARILTDKEVAEHARKLDDKLRVEFEQKLKELEVAGGGKWHLPYPVRSFLTWLILAVSAILGLFLISQGVSFYSEIKVMPQPFNWIVGIGAGLLASILVLLILKLLLMLISLHRSPGISLKTMEVLKERQSWQKLANEHSEKAQTELKKYLKSYKLNGDTRKRLIAVGLTEQEYESLLTGKDYLLSDEVPLSPDEWIAQFTNRFQGILDSVAKRRTKQYATRAGLGTAISPVTIIDQSVVLYSCVALIKDLMFLYHLRPAFGQTAVILARAILNTYLSGMLEEVTEKAADSLSESISDWSGDMAGLLGSGLGRAIGTKTTEAMLNGFLIWRLGKRTMSQIQPVTNK